jgi:hypothetical protein
MMDALLHHFVQAQILVLGVAARWLVGGGTQRGVRISLWVSAANLPAWFYVSWETSSWGMGALNVIYTALYVRALLNTRSSP